MHGIILALIISLFVIQSANAGYTSEENDEKSKSLYSAVTSILGSTDSSKHQHKHTYDSPPCASGGCPGALRPCYSATGCPQPTEPVYNSGIGYSANPAASVYMNGGYAAGHLPAAPQPSHTGAQVYPPPYQAPSGSYVPAANIAPGSGNASPYRPPVSPVSSQGGYAAAGYTQPGSAGAQVYPPPYQAPSGSYVPAANIPPGSGNASPYRPPVSPVSSQGGYAAAGYTQPGSAPAPHTHWNSNPSHYGYQGPRGYSVYDHSLKTNSEYTEVGTHKGPLQHANGYGYGSGYGGGYNGLFNRPGF